MTFVPGASASAHMRRHRVQCAVRQCSKRWEQWSVRAQSAATEVVYTKKEACLVLCGLVCTRVGVELTASSVEAMLSMFAAPTFWSSTWRLARSTTAIRTTRSARVSPTM
mmetsp:Transcript_25335/g.64427  ORF Transcript_25335/g.64427 Transcript_25335/m.64427 type:complete len:110 (-) Transcript_25335:62-391(-)